MSSMISYLIAPVLGGIIGYVTNAIAIRMLFRPHTEKRILGFQVPFTPGIIPKEKDNIADAIGGAISENLMNKEVLEKYLLSDEMVAKVRNSVEEFVGRLKENPESVKSFLCHYLSEEEVMGIAASVNDNITQQTYTKLTDPAVGEMVARVAMKSVEEKLNGDGAKMLLSGISGVTKGLKGIAASLLGVDLVAAILGLLREPAEKFLANRINNILQENGEQIVSDMLGNEVNAFLNKPICKLLEGHEDQLAKLPDSVESVYKKIITEHLPRILESIDIRKIVSERIKEMDVAEAEEIIIHVMNKELRAIEWLGALLGMIMGCVELLLRLLDN